MDHFQWNFPQKSLDEEQKTLWQDLVQSWQDGWCLLCAPGSVVAQGGPETPRNMGHHRRLWEKGLPRIRSNQKLKAAFQHF